MKTTKTAKFKMREPPTPLQKEIKQVKAQIPTSGAPMASICDTLAAQIQTQSSDRGYKHLTSAYLLSNLDKIEVKSQNAGSGYYSQSKLYAMFNFPESDGDFTRRMKDYELEIAEYQTWRKENAKQVAEHERAAEKKTQDKLNQEQAKLNSKMLALQAKMNKLQKAA